MLQERLTWAFPVGSMARPVPSPTAAWRSQLDNSKAAGAEHCATAAAAPLRQALGEARRCPGGSRAGLSVPPVTAWQGGARTELPPPLQQPRARRPSPAGSLPAGAASRAGQHKVQGTKAFPHQSGSKPSTSLSGNQSSPIYSLGSPAEPKTQGFLFCKSL